MFEEFWFNPPVADVCILLVGDVYIRRFLDCKSIISSVIKEDLPKKAMVICTSKKSILIVNVHRIPREDVTPEHIRDEVSEFYERKKCMVFDPQFDGDRSGHVFSTLCTILGYFKRPKDIRYLMTPFCKGCWEFDLTQRYAIAKSPCGNPYHVLCPNCAMDANIVKCPYEKCLLGDILFRDLIND